MPYRAQLVEDIGEKMIFAQRMVLEFQHYPDRVKVWADLVRHYEGVLHSLMAERE